MRAGGLFSNPQMFDVSDNPDFTEVIALNMDDGAVRSIDITYRGFPETVHARCVVASAGGFQANLDWMRQYWGDAVDNFVIRGTPYNRGRVLKNLLDQVPGTLRTRVLY